MPTGIDWGTTNSSLAVYAKGEAKLAEFTLHEKKTSSFRSALYFPTEATRGISLLAGPEALERYIEEQGSGRFIKSIKNFLTSRLFTSTQIAGSHFEVEDLIAVIIKRLAEGARKQFGTITEPIVVGRPVRFVNQETAEDEIFALARIREGFKRAGFPHITFEYEPVAAASTYEQRLSKDETILVADFGGGTSDFCIIKVGPSYRGNSNQERVLATGGIGLAGDVFDGRIVQSGLCPSLGLNESYQEYMGSMLPVPHWIFSRFSNLSQFPSLRSVANLRLIASICKAPLHPNGLDTLFEIVEQNRGYELFERVSELKTKLSNEEKSVFYAQYDSATLNVPISKDDFEGWIAEPLGEIQSEIKHILNISKLIPADIDRVFMTGGSALVPAVRAVLSDIFGSEKLAGGEEFTSIASGLAHLADQDSTTSLF
jgi:hypothetical chaperone protein